MTEIQVEGINQRHRAGESAQTRANRNYKRRKSAKLAKEGFKHVRAMVSENAQLGLSAYQEKYELSSREKAINHIFEGYAGSHA